MDFYTQEKIEQMKTKKMYEQGGMCAGCGRHFKKGELKDLSHILPQRKWILALYGKEILYHELAMKLTHHNDDCNSGVQISPNKTGLVNELVENIRRAIDEAT